MELRTVTKLDKRNETTLKKKKKKKIDDTSSRKIVALFLFLQFTATL